MRVRLTGVLAAFLGIAGFGQAIAQEVPFFLPFGQSRVVAPQAAGSCDERLRPPLIQIGVAVLQDIKELEQRPEAQPEAWVDAVRQQYRKCIGLVIRSAERMAGRDTAFSADELAVRNGLVERRLVRLALTGRVSKTEFDSLAKRLQGNY
jgi:hypothetical protein